MSTPPRPEDRRTPVEETGEIVAGDDQAIGRAFVWSLVAVLVVLILGGVAYGVRYLSGLYDDPPVTAIVPPVPPRLRDAPTTAKPPLLPLADVTESAGVAFTHTNGARGDKLLPETMGSGCAFFDFDNDGDQDLLLLNSSEWPGKAPAGDPPPTMALFVNDGKGNFQDVTAESGLADSFYGMGAATGDYDNDGWVDLFVTAVGLNRLYRNERGKFVDVTAEAGVGGVEDQWSSGCAWLDIDNDTDLDLFVCNYIKWSRDIDIKQDFRLVGVGRAYGPPMAFEGAYSYLYRNDGEGKFSDISAEAGIQVQNPATGVPMGKSLGVAPVDIDLDGYMDIIVANDTVQNFLFHNRKDGTFEEIGAESGIAFDTAGNARGAMGTDSGCVHNDGALAVVIGNFANEQTALYVTTDDRLQFVDEALSSGLGPQTRLNLTFGVFFLDIDLDGRLDILAANGHLENDINKVQESQTYAQPPRLFWNMGPDQPAGFYALKDEHTKSDFSRALVGRGSAAADIDGDGDLDLALTASGGTARLLRNDQELGHHWVRIKLVGKKCNRDAIGAWVEVHVDEQVLERQVMPTKSYLSQSELPVTFGLGKSDKIGKVVIRWPDGERQELPGLEADLLHVIEQTAP
jgi:hypothetical protein